MGKKMESTPQFLIVDAYEDISERIDGPYDPFLPDESSEEELEAYEKEFTEAHKRILGIASQFGKREEEYGDGDFSMSDDTYHSRGITVLLENEKMVGSEFILAIHKTLKIMTEDYAVSVQAEFAGEYVYIGVTKDNMIGHSDDPKLLKQFGFKK